MASQGEFIQILSDSALADLQKLNAELVKTVASVSKVNELMGSTPSGSAEGITALNKQYQNQGKIIDSLQSKLDAAAAKQIANAEKQRLAEIKLAQQREKAFDNYEKQLVNEQKKLDAATGTYNKLQAKLNVLTKEYRDLAAQKEITNKLTDDEQKRYDFLSGKITKYDTALKAVDSSMGKYQRNVGNYKSGFDAIGASLNQLTREAPAFANSMQTGFLAISNNLPILFDALSQATAKNKEMTAAGEKTVPVWKQLVNGLFSFQTALSVGVTLLTLYGDDIVKWGLSLFSTAEAVDQVAQNQKNLNEVTQEGKKNAVEEQTRLKLLLETAKDANLSYKERVTAVEKLQDQYPAYFGNLSKEKILAGDTAAAEAELTAAIIARAQAQAAVSKITEVQAKIIDEELKRDQLRISLQNEQRTLEARLADDAQRSTDQTRQKIAASKDNVRRAKEEIEVTNQNIKILNSESDAYLKYAIVKEKASAKLDIQAEKEKKAKKEKKKADRDDIEAVNTLTRTNDTYIGSLEEQKKKLIELQKALSKNNADWKKYQIIIDAVQISIDQLTKGESVITKDLQDTAAKNAAAMTKQAESTFDASKRMIELQKETKKYLESFAPDFITQSGFGALNKFLDGTFTKLMEGAQGIEKFGVAFTAMTEVLQEGYNFIQQASQANFDEEYKRLDKQKEIALKFAGDSAAGKQKIEDEYDAKHKEIAKREAKAKKEAAIFNTIIDVAQAVVASVAASPLTFGLPFSAFAAAIGAAQIAIISAQKIPEFNQGGVHDGGLMLVNDGKGSNFKETIVTPSGKVMKPQGKNVVMDAPKGTQIFTHDQWNDKLSKVLTSGQVNGNLPVINGGISEEAIDRVMAKHFKNITTQSVTFDRNGIQMWQENQGNRTIRQANRNSGTGFSV